MNTIEMQIESVVDNILSDYSLGRDVDKIDLYRHPDKDVIIDIIAKLLRIVYPGYSRDKTYRIYNAKHNLSMLIEDVMFNLSSQIAMVLPEGKDAENICLQFLGTIPAVRALVQTDLQAAYDGDPAATSIDEIIFSYPGVGKMVVDAIGNRDIPSVTGGIVMTTIMVTCVNLVIDLLYAFVDPRIKLTQKED